MVGTLAVLTATATILGLRAGASRIEATNDSPNLWTGLALMSTAWVLDTSGVTLFWGTLFALTTAAVIGWRRSGKSLSVDVSIDDE